MCLCLSMRKIWDVCVLWSWLLMTQCDRVTMMMMMVRILADGVYHKPSTFQTPAYLISTKVK